MGLSPGGGAEGHRQVCLPGRAWPQLPTLTWSAGCAWLALAPGVGCCSCFMAVIARGPYLALTSSRALQTRGPPLGRDRMSQAPCSRIGGRQSGSDGVGGER